MSNVIRVIAAVVDQHQLTCYKEDGTEYIVKQGDPELRRILDIVQPILQDGGVAEVDLTKETSDGLEYREFEKKTGGLVKFFKVLKEEAEKFLTKLGANTDTVSSLTLGKVPTSNKGVSSVVVGRKAGAKVDEAKAKQNAAVEEIMANAVHTSDDKFSAPMADTHDEKGALISEGSETIIAVMGDTVVPGVEKLAGQFEYAAKQGNSTIGMERFLARIGKVIADRGHSVQDLLKFLERGDLPIADDGCFVAYKILKERGDHFVDCHTGKVQQRIGSYVHMDHSLVDHNRSNECSNGLHVARRGYIGSFYGDVCTLIKVAPEDVIAVPNYDANKMRVCGYHIIDLLSDSDYKKLKRDNSITDTVAASIQLGKALAGDHVGITQRVKITQQQGGGVVITDVVNKKNAGKVVQAQRSSTKRMAKSIEKAPAKQKNSAPKVDAKAVAKSVAASKANGGSSRKQRAYDLLEIINSAAQPKVIYKAAKELVEFKKASKASWETLGVTMLLADRVVSLAATEPVDMEEPVPAPAPKAKAKKVAVKPAKAAAPATTAYAPGERVKMVQALFDSVKTGNKQAALSILDIKKRSKKSWEAIGLTHKQGERVTKLAKK